MMNNDAIRDLARTLASITADELRDDVREMLAEDDLVDGSITITALASFYAEGILECIADDHANVSMTDDYEIAEAATMIRLINLNDEFVLGIPFDL